MKLGEYNRYVFEAKSVELGNRWCWTGFPVSRVVMSVLESGASDGMMDNDETGLSADEGRCRSHDRTSRDREGDKEGGSNRSH